MLASDDYSDVYILSNMNEKAKKLSSYLITAAGAAFPRCSKKKRFNLRKLPKTWWDKDYELAKQKKSQKGFPETPLSYHASLI